MVETKSSSPCYAKLVEQEKRLSAISGALSVLNWDRSVMMPAKSGDVRTDQMSELSVIHHEILTSSERDDLISKAFDEELESPERANLIEIKRQYVRASALPARLVESLSRASSECEIIWREARENDDFKLVQNKLQELIDLTKEHAELLGSKLGLTPYDALIDGFDPGSSMSKIKPLFDHLSKELPPIISLIEEKQADHPALEMTGSFPTDKQEELGRIIMKALGFDFDRGRLDVSHHPFTGGVPGDVRITTRYDGHNFTNALMGVIHETGHALYESGLPSEWIQQPVGRARGLSLHESQSLFYEMQLARHPAFLAYILPIAKKLFQGSGPSWELDNFIKIYSKVERSLIRVNADEVTYPLHVILRCNIEQRLIDGSLYVKDLPDAWNESMNSLLGITPVSNKEGCLQDIHWYTGAFGYFPTYTLGALAAAQLFAAMKAEMTQTEELLGTGQFSEILDWVRSKIHQKASFYSTDEILISATGKTLDVDAFINHINQRYAA